MGKALAKSERLADLAAGLREDGLEVRELHLLGIILEGRVKRPGPTAYARELRRRGVDITAGQVASIMRNPAFQQARDRLVGELVLDAGMSSVFRTMVDRASDPDDPHGVQAARLLMQAKGMLKTNNEPVHTPQTDPFARAVLELRSGGKVTAIERRLEVEVEGTDPGARNSPARPEPEIEDLDTGIVDADFEVEGD